MMKWIDLDAIYAAWTGDFEPLAREIEDGKALTEEAAEFLAMHLRGEINWPRGNKRTWAQIQRDLQTYFEVVAQGMDEKLSMEKRIFLYCDETGSNPDTVKSAIRRAQREREELHPQATVRPG